MEEYHRRRRREWPSPQLIDEVSKLPMIFVLVGHKDSSYSNLQARQSWSYSEFKLISSLPKHVIQGYIALEYIMKTFLEFRRGQIESNGGRSQIGIYHLKNVLLHHLEKTTTIFGQIFISFVYKPVSRSQLPHSKWETSQLFLGGV